MKMVSLTKWLVSMLMVLAVFMFMACSDDPAPHTHSFGEWRTTQNATCDAPGERRRECSCGETQREEIPRLTGSQCQGGNTNPTTGTITVRNNSNDFDIVHVTIFDAGNWNKVIDRRANIKPGGSESYTLNPDKYIVGVLDNWEDWIQGNQVTVTAGGTVTVSYDGFSLR